jgi:hypothetical protein
MNETLDARDTESSDHSCGRSRLLLPYLLGALACATACGSSSSSGAGAGGAHAIGGAGGTAGAGGSSALPPSSGGSAGSPLVGAGGMSTASGGATTPNGGSTTASTGGSAGATGSGGTTSGGTNSAGTSGSAPTGGAASDADSGATSGCTRDALVQLRDTYFKAIAAHDASMLPTATTVKFTENGKPTMLGDGFWKTAGAVKFKRSALDTASCNSVTESVVTEGSTDIVFGLRLGSAGGKVSEIESIVVRQGDYFSSPSALAASASEDWETVLAADQRPKQDDLKKLVDTYFKQFPGGACNFASDCKRLENGFSPGGCTAGLTCSTSSAPGSSSMTPRLYLYDLDAGIAVGFVLFAGTYTDFHMFEVRGGQVHGVHATLAKATSSGW